MPVASFERALDEWVFILVQVRENTVLVRQVTVRSREASSLSRSERVWLSAHILKAALQTYSNKTFIVRLNDRSSLMTYLSARVTSAQSSAFYIAL